MRLTTKSRYGVRAIFDIAYHFRGNPVKIRDIAKRQEISICYLEQIFYTLKKAHIVKSIRGPGGGYILAKDPRKTTIRDIIEAMREPIDPVFCVDSGTAIGITKNCSRAEQCVTRLIWKEAGENIKQFFNSITVSDLCKRAHDLGIKRDLKHPFGYSI